MISLLSPFNKINILKLVKFVNIKKFKFSYFLHLQISKFFILYFYRMKKGECPTGIDL